MLYFTDKYSDFDFYEVKNMKSNKEQENIISQINEHKPQVGGIYDDYIIWILYDDGTLNISGSGRIGSCKVEDDIPWHIYAPKITRIVIGEGITSLGAMVFEGCTAATSVEIPNTVTEIGFAAFSNCTSLVNLTLPDSIKTIGEYAFSVCTSLKSINIPSGVTHLKYWTFAYCSSLESVTIENSNIQTDSDVFYKCTAFKEIKKKTKT